MSNQGTDRRIESSDVAAYIQLCLNAQVSLGEIRESLRRMGVKRNIVEAALRDIGQDETLAAEITGSIVIENPYPKDTLVPLHDPVSRFEANVIADDIIIELEAKMPKHIAQHDARSESLAQVWRKPAQVELLPGPLPTGLRTENSGEAQEERRGRIHELPGAIRTFLLSMPYFALAAVMGITAYQFFLPIAQTWFKDGLPDFSQTSSKLVAGLGATGAQLTQQAQIASAQYFGTTSSRQDSGRSRNVRGGSRLRSSDAIRRPGSWAMRPTRKASLTAGGRVQQKRYYSRTNSR